MPPNRDRDVMISLSLKEERWISMVALYFNAYDEPNITPHFDILATDVQAKQDRLVASVRHNGQIMRLVKFAPVKTSLLKIRLVNSIARLRTVTEIELYGPLSGQEGKPGFDDPDGQNTYMGDFSRVDRRVKKLADSYLAPLTKNGGNSDEVDWYAPLAQILVSRDRFYLGRTFGKNTAHALEKPDQDLYWSRPCGLGFTPVGALYGGLLLRCGVDGKLYCLNPETGTELWSVKLGKRLFGCPVAIDEDVYHTCDGKLYQIDLASGGVMKDAPISGTVFGSLATDGKHVFFVSDDGFLYAHRAADLALAWKVPIAKESDSTPAVADGVVYLADQQGTAWAVSAADGKVVWRTELDDEFMRCPVVGPDKVIFGCRGGKLAVLERNTGKVIWSKKVESRFDYEPLLLDDRLLFFRDNKGMLARLTDGSETPLEWGPPAKGDAKPPRTSFTLPRDPTVPIGYYKNHLFFIARPGEEHHREFQVNMPWHVNGGSFTVLKPTPPEKPPAPQEKKK
jgi:outer membrane protein assembly factor BamB